MLLDIENEGNSLIISYYNSEGKVSFKTIPLKNISNWMICRESDKSKDKKFTNWDGRAVKKYTSKFLNKHSITELFERLSKEDQDEIFGTHYPDIYFIDIEVEIVDGFPEADSAKEKITTITFTTPKNQVIVFSHLNLPAKSIANVQSSIDKYFEQTGKKFTFIYKKFDTEYDMLYTFLSEIVQKKIPMMSGWNVIGYDWKYIINRARRLGIDPSIASPSGKLNNQNNDIPLHVGIMDYMDLYKAWDRSVDVKENFKLNTVAEVVVGLKKISYDGSLKDLLEKDFEKYVFYTAVDTLLVMLIHEKLKTMEIVLTLANLCKISIYKADSPVSITESLLAREFLKDNKILASDFNIRKENKDEQYEGAYVKKPITGRHKAVACFDFASLYPSIMRQMNVSPDSFIMKVDPDVRNEYKQDDRIVAVNGCVYSTKDSILKGILNRLYSQRKEYKKEMFKYEMEADEIKHILEKRKSA